MANTYPELPGSYHDAAREFIQILHGLYDPYVEQADELPFDTGIEYLVAAPGAILKFCPDAVGRVSVDLPLPGFDENNTRITVHEAPPVEPSDQWDAGRWSHSVNTTLSPVPDGLHLYRVCEKYRKGADIMMPLIGDTVIEDVEDRVLVGPEADAVLEWAGKLRPHKRPRPISLMNVGRLASKESLEDAARTPGRVFSDAVALQFDTVNPEAVRDHGSFLFRTLDGKPGVEAAELTDVRQVTLWHKPQDDHDLPLVEHPREREGFRTPKSRDYPMPHVTLTNGREIESHKVTVYTENDRVYSQRGRRPHPAEPYSMAVGGVVLMQGMCPAVHGAPPVELNPLQVAGVVELLHTVEPTQPVWKQKPRRWDEMEF